MAHHKNGYFDIHASVFDSLEGINGAAVLYATHDSNQAISFHSTTITNCVSNNKIIRVLSVEYYNKLET